MGGALGVDSRPGKGSQFYFTAQFASVEPTVETLPLAKASAVGN